MDEPWCGMVWALLTGALLALVMWLSIDDGPGGRR